MNKGDERWEWEKKGRKKNKKGEKGRKTISAEGRSSLSAAKALGEWEHVGKKEEGVPSGFGGFFPAQLVSLFFFGMSLIFARARALFSP